MSIYSEFKQLSALYIPELLNIISSAKKYDLPSEVEHNPNPSRDFKLPFDVTYVENEETQTCVVLSHDRKVNDIVGLECQHLKSFPSHYVVIGGSLPFQYDKKGDLDLGYCTFRIDLYSLLSGFLKVNEKAIDYDNCARNNNIIKVIFDFYHLR